MERVLFLVKAREFGGLEIVLLDWLSGIEYSKTSAALCYRADLLREKLAAKGLPVECVKLSIAEEEPSWKVFPKWLRLFSSLRPQKIVLLEGHVGDFSLIEVLAAHLSTHGRVLLFAGGGGSVAYPTTTGRTKLYYGFLPGIGLHRYKDILKHRLRFALLRHTFVSSQGLKDNLLAKFGCPPARVSVLYHGVDTARFRPSPAERIEYRRALGIPDDATMIVSHGRLAPVKRVDRILKAFAVLSAQYPNLWLVMTSYGPLKDELERTISSSDVYRKVKLLGFQEDASKLLKAGDIYVLASDREGFGIALLEAMATGLVCVATNSGGPAEILVNDENGILVEVSEEGVLAGLRRALGLSPEERARLVQGGRETAQSRFEIHAAIERALNALEIPKR